MGENDLHSNRRLLPIAYYEDPYTRDRRTHAILIDCCMQKYPPFLEIDKKIQEQYVREIEQSCFDRALVLARKRNISTNWGNETFIMIYNNIVHNVQFNLLYSPSITGSQYLIQNIMEGIINASNVGSMSSREMRPLSSKHIYDEIELRKQQTIIKKYSRQYRCPKCGERKTTEVEKQIRCSDEGSTVFITCEIPNCGNTWTQ